MKLFKMGYPKPNVPQWLVCGFSSDNTNWVECDITLLILVNIQYVAAKKENPNAIMILRIVTQLLEILDWISTHWLNEDQ
jgi:hypothetical protein